MRADSCHLVKANFCHTSIFWRHLRLFVRFSLSHSCRSACAMHFSRSPPWQSTTDPFCGLWNLWPFPRIKLCHLKPGRSKFEILWNVRWLRRPWLPFQDNERTNACIFTYFMSDCKQKPIGSMGLVYLPLFTHIWLIFMVYIPVPWIRHG